MLAARTKSLKPSPTLALASQAKKLKAEGHDVISLSVGEPDWDSFEVAKQAGTEAIEQGQTKYAPASGLPELRQALTKDLKEQTGVEWTTDQITVTAGAKFLVYGALQVLCDPKDEVLIPAPYWVSYPVMAELAEATAKVVACTAASNFKLTATSLEQALTPQSKVLILNSPSNPTGELYTREELQELADVIRRHERLVVISDDIYNQLIFSDEVAAPHLLQVAPDLKERTVCINGASKAYSMTGWRVGWAAGPEPIIKAMTNLQSQSVSCASAFSQLAALAAVERGQEELKKARQLLKQRRDFAVKELNALAGLKASLPSGAFYIWLDVSECFGRTLGGVSIEGSRDFARALLDQQKVVVVPGADFGLDGYVRLSYALKEERMREAITRLRSFLA